MGIYPFIIGTESPCSPKPEPFLTSELTKVKKSENGGIQIKDVDVSLLPQLFLSGFWKMKLPSVKEAKIF